MILLYRSTVEFGSTAGRSNKIKDKGKERPDVEYMEQTTNTVAESTSSAVVNEQQENVSLWFSFNTEDVIKLVPPFTCIYSTPSTVHAFLT